MDSMDSCHSFNLNDQPPAESRNEEPDPNHLKQHQLSFSSLEEGGNLAEVMAEIQRENLKIVKSLAGLFEKYDEIKHQLTRLMDEDDDNDDNTLPKKRKAVCLSDCCISDDVCFSRARLMSHKPKISTAFIRVDESDTSLAVKDGYQWRKYGQKVTRDNPSPRAYFKCSFAPLCPVKKKVQRSVDDSTVLVVTYEGMHNHKKPPSGATLSPLAADVLIEADDDDVATGMLQPRLVQQMASSLTKDNAFTSALAAAIYSQVLQQKTSF